MANIIIDKSIKPENAFWKIKCLLVIIDFLKGVFLTNRIDNKVSSTRDSRKRENTTYSGSILCFFFKLIKTKKDSTDIIK